MDADTVIDRLLGFQAAQARAVHVQELPARPAVYAQLEMAPEVRSALALDGIERLYSHQAEAIEHIRAHRSVVIVTGTASGKTLCYTIPVLERLMQDPFATVLCLYPTKALTQDQLRGMEELGSRIPGLGRFAGTYDGDTPQRQRRRIRDQGRVILTNPDMLHQGILPNHSRWSRFFSHLQYVVIDEVHAYRGVFGSHLANVIRRLRRVCAHYGADPVFVCCSATIGNPQAHASELVGAPVALVDRDGAPRGRKRFVFWNPPLLHGEQETPEQAGGERRSALWTAVRLMVDLIRNDMQVITFVQTRLAAELVFKYARQLLERDSPRLAKRIHAYRGGYLPEERREIERRLADGELMGVSSTNALELGIDIGSLDAAVLVGYPGTIASTWQRAGRAGRGTQDALVFLVGRNSPIDQYLMGHHQYLFDQNPEYAVVDPDNPHVVVGHLQCALHELPLPTTDIDRFGEFAPDLLELLEEQQVVRCLDQTWYWASTDFPARHVSLRSISGVMYTIQDAADQTRIIGTTDELSAMTQLHTHAVYLHEAETYFVDQLDMDRKVALVRRMDLDYYTQSVQSSQIRVDSTDETREWRGCRIGFGDVTAVTHIPMFKKIKFNSRDSLGCETLEMPAQQLETVAFWLVPPGTVVERVRAGKRVLGEALTGVANVLLQVAPMFVMCDEQDIGVVVDAANLGDDALFLYDKHPGGMGYAERCVEVLDELMAAVYTVIRECPCEDGCPSCVGVAVTPGSAGDLDAAVGRLAWSERGSFIVSGDGCR
jgi:DEAD/DEAH box helicase domain-containing protein